MANFFAYFDPKERINFRDLLFLICCPAHRSIDVKQELEKAGLTFHEATSRRDMIPGRDKAFVFVSGGINFASPEDIGVCYLRLVHILKGKWLNAVLSKVTPGQDVLVTVASYLQDVPEISWNEVTLFPFFPFFLVDLVPIISN